MTTQERVTHNFYRSTLSSPPLAVSAKGSEIIDENGKHYIDASGGAAVSSIGHCDARVVEAIRRQASKLDYAHSGAFTSAASEELADLVCNSTPLELERVQFVGSGSEAVETAIKLARQYHLESGQSGRHHVISRRQSYHGNTLGALARSGSVARQKVYLPMLVDEPNIDPCFEYHYRYPQESIGAYGKRVADTLETEILRLGADSVSAFIAETVVGATAGAVTATPGYFKHIREICDRYGVLLILDEVMCGTYRTGTFLACELEGIQPDIVTLAKGLGGGYQSIAAVLCTEAIHQAFVDGSGTFIHGHTYMAHPIGCAAALAVQKVICDDGLAENVVSQGKSLASLLRQRLEKHPFVGDIRGRGLLHAVELVNDRDTKQPFPSHWNLAAKIGAECRKQGLLVYPGSGTIDGHIGDHILLAPPYNIEKKTLEKIVDRLGCAIDVAIG